MQTFLDRQLMDTEEEDPFLTASAIYCISLGKKVMSDMEDDWTEEYYQFTKAGKNVFRVGVDESKKITGITLQEGSTSIVKTSEGFYVGYPARTLFTKKPMQWSTYFEGTSFAMSGHWTYAVLDSDLNNTDIPYKVSDLKPTAKLYTISYSHEIYEEYGY